MGGPYILELDNRSYLLKRQTNLLNISNVNFLTFSDTRTKANKMNYN